MEMKHYDNNYYGFENVTSFNCKSFELLSCILSCCKQQQAYNSLPRGQWHAWKLMGTSINVVCRDCNKLVFSFFKTLTCVAKKLSNIQKMFGQKTKSNLTTWKKHQKKMQYWNLLFHYYVILPYTFKVKRMHKIRRRDTV